MSIFWHPIFTFTHQCCEKIQTISNNFVTFHSSTGHDQVVETLISKGANVDPKDLNGRTPLHLALKKGNQSISSTSIQQLV